MQIRSLGAGIGLLGLIAAGMIYAASLSKADERFLSMAARTDMTEANEGQLANQQATRGDVKEFANTLVQDHTDSYHQISELASQKGVSIPKGINSAKISSIVHLVHAKGTSFDKQFVQDEIAGHRQAIAEFKHEAEHGQDAEVKAYANRMIPVLEKHLHQAEDLAKPTKKS